jgi:hypothetical protein
MGESKLMTPKLRFGHWLFVLCSNTLGCARQAKMHTGAQCLAGARVV